MKNEKQENVGLRVTLAGLIGCLIGTVIVWQYTGNVLARALAIPISFLAGCIAYAPLTFCAAFPAAWNRATSWRPDKVHWVAYAAMVLSFTCVGVVAGSGFAWVAFLALLVMGHSLVQSSLIFLGGAVMWFVLVILFALLGLTTTQPANNSWKFHQEDLDLAKKWNVVTMPFWVLYYFGYGLYKLVPMLPGAVKATVKFLFLTLPRFVRDFAFALAELTASHGRLTSGLAAAIGTLVCVWYHWAPIPGCLVGGMIGLALWSASCVALRFRPIHLVEATAVA